MLFFPASTLYIPCYRCLRRFRKGRWYVVMMAKNKIKNEKKKKIDRVRERDRIS